MKTFLKFSDVQDNCEDLNSLVRNLLGLSSGEIDELFKYLQRRLALVHQDTSIASNVFSERDIRHIHALFFQDTERNMIPHKCCVYRCVLQQLLRYVFFLITRVRRYTP
jgi:hypothetical protein